VRVIVSSLSYFLLIIVLGVYLSIILVGRRHWMGADGQSMLGHYLVRGPSLVLIDRRQRSIFPITSHSPGLHFQQVSSLSNDTRDLANLRTSIRSGSKPSSTRVPDEFVKVKTTWFPCSRSWNGTPAAKWSCSSTIWGVQQRGHSRGRSLRHPPHGGRTESRGESHNRSSFWSGVHLRRGKSGRAVL
jgi:hypothetical protein